MIWRRSRAFCLSALAMGIVSLLLPAYVSSQVPGTFRLTLGDAARLAAERSNPVLEARARTEGAEARVRESTGAFLPHLEADVTRGARTFNTASFGLDFPTPAGQAPFFDPDGEVVGPVRSADLRARAEVALLDLAALGRRRSARASLSAAREGEDAAANAVATSAARAYLSALRARADVTAREEDLRLAEDLLEVARGLLEAGVAVAIDVTRAQSQVATIRAQLLSSQYQADISELALRRALRLSDEAAMELVDDLESLSVSVGDVPSEEDAVARALETRSDLGMAEAYHAAAQETLSATRAGRLPRVTAALDEGYYGKRFGDVLGTYSWSVRLSLPLFDGFQRSARIQAQAAQVRELSYQIDDLEEDVVFQVRQALLGLEAAQEQAAAAEERQRLADLEVAQEEERVRAGVAGTADVVRAAMRLNEARTGRLDALTAVQASRVALATAMGTVSELP